MIDPKHELALEVASNLVEIGVTEGRSTDEQALRIMAGICTNPERLVAFAALIESVR